MELTQKESEMNETQAPCTRHNTNLSTGGFTLIEILVVIGIIAVLLGILFPTFSHVREKGRQTVCQSNLRQIAAAMQQYLQDYDAVYPKEMFVYKANGVATEVGWQEVLLPYTKSRAIFHCPTHAISKEKTRFEYEDYRLNIQRLSIFTVSASSTLTVDGRHEAEVPNTSTIWLNEDKVTIFENHECDYCAGSTGSCGRYFIGSTIHGGGGNYSFLDGHVKWFAPSGIAELDCQNGPMPAVVNSL